MATDTTFKSKIGLWVVTNATPAQVKTRLADVRTIFRDELIAFLAGVPNVSLVGGEAQAFVTEPRGDFDQDTQTFSGTDYLEVVIYLQITLRHPDGANRRTVQAGLDDAVRGILKGAVKDAAIGGSGATIRKFFYKGLSGGVEEDG